MQVMENLEIPSHYSCVDGRSVHATAGTAALGIDDFGPIAVKSREQTAIDDEERAEIGPKQKVIKPVRL